MKAQQKSGMILFIIIGTFILFVNSDRMTEKMPIGTPLPGIDIIQETKNTSLKGDSLEATIVIWFDPKCEHCQYQLQSITENLNRFRNTQFIFLTDNIEFLEQEDNIRWRTIITASNTMFKFISEDKFRSLFGKVITPSLYLFDRKNLLRNKYYGEVKVNKILQLLAELNVPEQEGSGHN